MARFCRRRLVGQELKLFWRKSANTLVRLGYVAFLELLLCSLLSLSLAVSAADLVLAAVIVVLAAGSIASLISLFFKNGPYLEGSVYEKRSLWSSVMCWQVRRVTVDLDEVTAQVQARRKQVEDERAAEIASLQAVASKKGQETNQLKIPVMSLVANPVSDAMIAVVDKEAGESPQISLPVRIGIQGVDAVVSEVAQRQQNIVETLSPRISRAEVLDKEGPHENCDRAQHSRSQEVSERLRIEGANEAKKRMRIEELIDPNRVFKTLFSGLKVGHPENVALLHPLFFLLRRLFVAMAIVWMSQCGVLSALLQQVVTILALCYLVTFQPWTDPALNKLHLANEVLLYVVLSVQLTITATADNYVQWDIGVFLILCIALALFGNLAYGYFVAARNFRILFPRLFKKLKATSSKLRNRLKFVACQKGKPKVLDRKSDKVILQAIETAENALIFKASSAADPESVEIIRNEPVLIPDTDRVLLEAIEWHEKGLIDVNEQTGEDLASTARAPVFELEATQKAASVLAGESAFRELTAMKKNGKQPVLIEVVRDSSPVGGRTTFKNSLGLLDQKNINEVGQSSPFFNNQNAQDVDDDHFYEVPVMPPLDEEVVSQKNAAQLFLQDAPLDGFACGSDLPPSQLALRPIQSTASFERKERGVYSDASISILHSQEGVPEMESNYFTQSHFKQSESSLDRRSPLDFAEPVKKSVYSGDSSLIRSGYATLQDIQLSLHNLKTSARKNEEKSTVKGFKEFAALSSSPQGRLGLVFERKRQSDILKKSHLLFGKELGHQTPFDQSGSVRSQSMFKMGGHELANESRRQPVQSGKPLLIVRSQSVAMQEPGSLMHQINRLNQRDGGEEAGAEELRRSLSNQHRVVLSRKNYYSGKFSTMSADSSSNQIQVKGVPKEEPAPGASTPQSHLAIAGLQSVINRKAQTKPNAQSFLIGLGKQTM